MLDVYVVLPRSASQGDGPVSRVRHVFVPLLAVLVKQIAQCYGDEHGDGDRQTDGHPHDLLVDPRETLS